MKTRSKQPAPPIRGRVDGAPNASGRSPQGAPVQMRDVAERAGVSITTVSHIVNNTRPVAIETRERVLLAMSELNFHKNAFGRRLKLGHSDSYGLIISDVENPFFPELIKSFETSAVETGCDILLYSTNYDPERARKAVSRMIENKVLGVAVMTSQLDAALVDELLRLDIPVVRLDAHEPPRRAFSNIHVDYSKGSTDAAARLRDLGHRDMVFITGPQTRISAVTYRTAFQEAIAQLNLPPVRLMEGGDSIDGGAAAVQELIGSGRLPTALLCGNDFAALGAIRALVEAGIRVPEDVSVIGADDISFARISIPALTTIRIPRDRLGHLAFDALKRMIRTKRKLGAEYSLETQFILRQSTGQARRDRRLSASAS